MRFEAGLRVRGGNLAAPGEAGAEVHAAAFPHKRLILLDQALIEDPAELKRIWVHELFHFVWWRLGNQRRSEWERLLSDELRKSAPGELGWSAEWRKRGLARSDRTRRTRHWREYCCESFCDSAAWLFSKPRRHAEFTLTREYRTFRQRWLTSFLGYNSK